MARIQITAIEAGHHSRGRERRWNTCRKKQRNEDRTHSGGRTSRRRDGAVHDGRRERYANDDKRAGLLQQLQEDSNQMGMKTCHLDHSCKTHRSDDDFKDIRLLHRLREGHEGCKRVACHASENQAACDKHQSGLVLFNERPAHRQNDDRREDHCHGCLLFSC